MISMRFFSLQEDNVQYPQTGVHIPDVNPGRPLNQRQQSAMATHLKNLVKDKLIRAKEKAKRDKKKAREEKAKAAQALRDLEEQHKARMTQSSTSDELPPGVSDYVPNEIHFPSSTEPESDEGLMQATQFVDTIQFVAAEDGTLEGCMKAMMENQKRTMMCLFDIKKDVASKMKV